MAGRRIAMDAGEFAARHGCTRRSVVRWIGEGMPGARRRRRSRAWTIDPGKADPWIAERRRRPRQAAAWELDLPPGIAPNGHTNGQVRGPTVNGQADRAGQVSALIEALLTTAIKQRRLDSAAVTALTRMSGELRQLEKHRLAMRMAEASLMSREEHRKTVVNLAAIIVSELQIHEHELPDLVVQVLAGAGIAVPPAGPVMRLLVEASSRAVARLRERISEAVEQTQLGSTQHAQQREDRTCVPAASPFRRNTCAAPGADRGARFTAQMGASTSTVAALPASSASRRRGSRSRGLQSTQGTKRPQDESPADQPRGRSLRLVGDGDNALVPLRIWPQRGAGAAAC
jgi:hypothetical protein